MPSFLCCILCCMAVKNVSFERLLVTFQMPYEMPKTLDTA